MTSKILSFSLGLIFAAASVHAVTYHEDMTSSDARSLGELPQFESSVQVSIGGFACSGSMLNSEWAALAGHCFNFVDGTRVTVRYIENGTTVASMAGTVYVFDNESPSGVTGSNTSDTVALVKLDNPLTQATHWVAPYDQFDEAGQVGWQTGIGQFGPFAGGQSGLSPSDRFFRAVTQKVSTTNVNYLIYQFNNSPELPNSSVDTTRFEGATAPGDSGGAFFLYSRGRFFNASTVWGAVGGVGFVNNRLSTHLDEIEDRTQTEFAPGLKFAYPKQLTPVARWVAQDLDQVDSSGVSSWADRYDGLSFSNSTDGGSGTPLFAANATPTGLAAVAFDGNAAMGLSALENPFEGETAMSVVMVVKASVAGAGVQTNGFGTMGLLDASAGEDAWGLSYSGNDRVGWSIEAQDDSVTGIFRGGAGNGSLSDNQWHVVVATWDGSEIPNDNAGDDLNMKLFVDSIDQVRAEQGASHFNVGRGAMSLLLGNSQTNGQGGFNGEIAELRLYSGELQVHEVDRIMTALKAQYVSGTPGVVFERPWADAIAIMAGHSLALRGSFTGGATNGAWDVISGPAAVTFSEFSSPTTEVEFDAAGLYHLRFTASNGVVTGDGDLFIDVYAPGFESTDATERNVTGSWMSRELGSTATGGGFSEVGTQLSVTGSGSGLGHDVGATYDHGHFAWKGVAGDFDLKARLDSLGNQSGPTRAGIMLRGGPGPTDSAAFVGLAPDGKAYVMFRENGGVWGDLIVEESPSVSLPAYLKLERRGKSVSALISADGVTYSPLVTQNVELAGVARAGFFVTSGNSANPITAVFNAVSLVQVGYASASIVESISNASSNGRFDYGVTLAGADEPWFTIAQDAGPSALAFGKDYNGNRQVYRASTVVSGSYRNRFLLDDGNALTFIRSADEVTFNTRFDFNNDGNFEGWNTNNVDFPLVTSGTLSAVANTGDPQISRSSLSINGTAQDQVQIRMQSSVNGSVQLFWGRNGAGGFAAARSIIVNYSGNGDYQTLALNMSGVAEWDGETITALRIDPINGASANGGSFAIDFIEISDGQPFVESRIGSSFDLNGDFEGWVTVKDLSAYVLGGRLQATTTGIDPILTNDIADFSADSIEAVLVRIKSTKAGSMQLFWSTTDSPGFAGARSVSTAITGDGEWQTARIPLRGNVEWDGKTIKNLRLDPVNQANAVLEIDAIAFSSGDADGDTLPDVYEEANGLDALLASDAGEDPDQDGLSSLAEYIAGTNPSDSSDRFEVTEISATGTAFQVAVDGVSGRVYFLKRKISLNDPMWTPVDSIGPLEANATLTLEDAELFDAAFYRVEVNLP
jgi:hypothetical protein